MDLKEINAILGEKLSAEDEEEILAEFENLETQVFLFLIESLAVQKLLTVIWPISFLIYYL